MKQNKALSPERAVVLGALREGPACGSQVIHRLEDQSENPFRGREGMLYPALHGLERSNLLRAQYRHTGSGYKRWFYQLTPKGRRLLEPQEGKPTPPTDLNASDETEKSEDPAIPAPADPEIDWNFTEVELQEPDGLAPDVLQWSKTAVKKLRFSPCFRRVKNELSGYVSDRIYELRHAQWQSYEEASAQVLPLMGDPKELGQQLQKLHKPWLGRLHRLLNLLLLSMLLVLLVAYIHDSSAFSDLRIRSIQQVLQEYEVMPGERDGAYVIAEQSWSCKDTVQVGPFQVDCAKLLWCIYYEPYDMTKNQLIVVLRFTAAPWHTPSQLIDLISCTSHSDDGKDTDADTGPTVYQFDYLHPHRINPFQTIVILKPYSSYYDRDLYRDPAWFEIALGRGDEKQTMKIELGPWELCPENYPRLEDEAAAIQNFYDRMIKHYVNLDHEADDPERSFLPAEAQAGETTVAVPWAAATVRINEDAQLEKTIDCVLELKGDMHTVPLFRKELRSRLRITALGTDEAELEYLVYPDRHWYDTACFLHLYWPRVEGAEGYALSYETEEGGPICTLRLEPGEEAAK